MKYLFNVVFLFIACNSLLAQQENDVPTDSIPISYYLDDGGLSISNLIIKTDVVAWLMAEANLVLERKWTNSISTEFGGGLMMSTPLWNYEGLSQKGRPEFVDTKLRNEGYSYFVKLKAYPKYDASLGWYISFQYRQKYFRYEINDTEQGQLESLRRLDFTLMVGYQRFLFDRLIVDASVGPGLADEQYSISNSGGGKSRRLIVPIALKIGYGLW